MHGQSIVHLDLKPENIMCHTRTSHKVSSIMTERRFSMMILDRHLSSTDKNHRFRTSATYRL